MARETVDAKAFRYIAEGRVNVLRVDQKTGEADVAVQGTSPDPYLVELRAGVWLCDCPAQLRCAHQAAAVLVVKPMHVVASFSSSELDALFEGQGAAGVGDEDPFEGL